MESLEAYRRLSQKELYSRIDTIRGKWGKRLLTLGHYYQKPEVLALSDAVGDSFALSAAAAKNTDCEVILFFGVRFMAETADILANSPTARGAKNGRRTVVLSPDPDAGCPMADMATLDEVERAWTELGKVIDTKSLIPVTYVNSSAEIKAFCGGLDGYACTSSNAAAVLNRAFSEASRVFFLPDQHLGRNTALAMGLNTDEIVLYNGGNATALRELERLDDDDMIPFDELQNAREGTGPLGGNSVEAIRRAKVILWNGFCPVHQRFTPNHLRKIRFSHPQMNIVVHPECRREIVAEAEESGSTKKILDLIVGSPPGSSWAVGTERQMVDALIRDYPDRNILPLSPERPMCETMDRISLASIARTLEALDRGEPINIVHVHTDVAASARAALERMLACH